MIRASLVRSLMLPPALMLALSAAACNSGGEKAGSNSSAGNAPANTSGAPANQAGNNMVNAGGPKLNLNTATGAEFKAAIPGLGDRMVHEFEEYRPYRSIQQFRREMAKYVGADQIATYEKYVFVPITPNESDAATLQQIPGLDGPEAQALISARPFASDEAFLSKLAGSVSEAELAVAKSYLSGR